MKKIIHFIQIFIILLLSSAIMFAGNVTVTVSGNSPLLISVRGETPNIEAGNFNVKVYYSSADLITSGVDASQLVTTFGWGIGFQTLSINSGSFSENSKTYTHELVYGNVDLGDQNDVWPTSDVIVLSLTFTNGATGEAFVKVESDGIADYLGSPHTVTLVGSAVTPLPVELSSFSVNSVEGTKAQLNWETATEINNYGFEIERTIAGSEKSKVESQNEELDWEKIAFVQGHGNSNSNKSYSFTDKNLVGGSRFLYRLKQIDIDGTFEYSDAVEIEVLPNKYELLQNYPNPFNPETNIKFSLPEDAKIAINIYNVLGQKVATILNKELKAGFHQVNFNTTSAGYRLASGVYIYTIETKNFSQVKKMILMK